MSDYSELAKLAEAAKKNWEDSGLNRYEEVERFINAASPESVLTLIAENDRLDVDNRSLKGSCSRLGAEHAKMTRTLKKANRMQLEARQARDQLKVENEALRKDAERYRQFRALTLNGLDDTPDEFDKEFDMQISSPENP